MATALQNRFRTIVVRALTLAFSLIFCAYAISDDPFYGGEPGFGKTQWIILILGLFLGFSAIALPIRFTRVVLTLTASSLLALVLGEIVGERLLSASFRKPYRADEQLLFALRPSIYTETRRSAVNGGDLIGYHINSDGFRGEEMKSNANVARVMVYGDSFVHATYSVDEETFVIQLRSRLREKVGQDVEVVNAGVSSYGPDQVSLRLEADLARFEPDVVIVAIFAGNDYGDLLRNKLFRLAEDGELDRNPAELAAVLRMRFELNVRESILKRAGRKLFRRLRPQEVPYLAGDSARPDWTVLIGHWLTAAEEEYRDFVVNENNIVTNVYNDHYSADLSLQPSSESARFKVRFMDAVLVRIKKTLQKSNSALVFLFIPHPIDVCENYDGARIDRLKFPEYERENLTKPLEEIAQREEVSFISLFQAFQQVDACALYFRGGDDHWNEEGQALAAEIMSKHLVEQRILAIRR